MNIIIKINQIKRKEKLHYLKKEEDFLDNNKFTQANTL